MKDIEFMKEYLEKNLVQGRFLHTLGVAETAIKLAKLYNVDEEKAEIAALAHDMAKNMKSEKLKELIDKNNIQLSIDEENTKELWHAIAGPILAKEVFEIDDNEILSAMRWHTTGKENMTSLEKIIYLADLIEPSRKFEGVDRLREISEKDLNLAVLEGLTHTTEYLLKKNQPIDINSMKARNYLLYTKQNI